MSGSGGDDKGWRPTSTPISRSGQGSGNGGDGIPDQCQIVENTALNSIDAQVLSTVRVGDTLEVVFQSGPPQRLVARTTNSNILGSITSPNMLQIIECIQSGVTYQAEIVSIRGAQCQVQITPTP